MWQDISHSQNESRGEVLHVSTAKRGRTGRLAATPGPGGKPTRLQSWLDRNGFTSAQLERATNMGRQDMGKIRMGRDVRRMTMLRILRGARKLSADVQLGDVFDLDPDSLEDGE